MRILKLVVIVMGAAIIIGTGYLFWQIYHLGAPPREAPATPAAARSDAAAAPDRVTLGLAPGCDIVAADVAGGRLFVRTGCGEVHVLDARSLRILSVIGR